YSNEPGMVFPDGYFDPDPPSGPVAGSTATAQSLPTSVGGLGGGRSATNSTSPVSSNTNQTQNSNQNGMNSGPYPNTWRGVYIKAIDVSLPAVFKKKQAPNARLKIGGEHVIVDAMGVSGYFYAEGILPMSEGKMDKWKYSLDHFGVTLLKNKVKGFGFGGKLVVPVTKESTPFTYLGKLDDAGNFSLTVTADADMEWPIWQVAQVNINEGSHIDILIQDDEFIPSATLHGSLNISASLSNGSDQNPDGKKLNLVGVHFESLVLQTQEAPYISAEKVYFSSGVVGADLAIFPISIDSIAFNDDNDQANLRFRLRVKFMKDKENFAGETFARLVGDLDESEQTHLWKYDKLIIEKIEIDVNVSGMHLVGSIEFFQGDDLYGSGFQGYLCIELEKLGGLMLQANAIFGAQEENGEPYRFWYFDAKVGFSPGIPIYPGLEINGLGGGAYHHMVLAGLAPSGYQGPGVVTSSTSCNTGMDGDAAVSRLWYQPSTQIKLGLKFSVDFVVAKDGVVNGTACLEIAFTQNWGVAYIALSGSAAFLRPMTGREQKMLARIEKLGNQDGRTVSQSDKDESEAPTLSVKASFLMQIVFTEINVQVYNNGSYQQSTLYPGFHGNFKVHLSVANGKFRGTSDPATYSCGGADIKFTTNEWHLYVGHYERNGGTVTTHYVSVGLYGEALNFNIAGYFMMGNDIPGPPPLPYKVKQKFGINDPPMDARNAASSNLANGTGFALGAHVEFSVWKEFKFFGKKRAGADILAGFDIAILKYGQNTYCKENGGSQVWQDFGAKRWRASGNLYAYVGGKVQKWKKRKKQWKTMFGINIGALVQGDVPNPVYARVKLKLPVVPDITIKAGKRCTVYNN
ncbi:MAG: hypothetical protein AAGK97_01505, partial [Bacteroidota bacterium]